MTYAKQNLLMQSIAQVILPLQNNLLLLLLPFVLLLLLLRLLGLRLL